MNLVIAFPIHHCCKIIPFLFISIETDLEQASCAFSNSRCFDRKALVSDRSCPRTIVNILLIKKDNSRDHDGTVPKHFASLVITHNVKGKNIILTNFFRI